MITSNSNFYIGRFRSVYGACIILLAFLQMSLAGVVLCFGTDGHIAFENYDSGACRDFSLNSIATNDRYLDISDHLKINHCGPCVDIRVSDDNSEYKLLASSDLISEIDIYAIAAYVLSSLWSEENFKQRFVIQELKAGNSFLETLQTNILIC